MEILSNLGTCLDLEPWGQQQCQLYSRGRALPIFWQIDFPQNFESGQYCYFLTQHQATSAGWPSNTRPDCGRLKPKVPRVFGQNQSVVQKNPGRQSISWPMRIVAQIPKKKLLIRQIFQKNKKKKNALRFYTIYEQKFPNLRQFLSITFPQRFRKAKNVRAKRRLNGVNKCF